MHKIKNFASKQ